MNAMAPHTAGITPLAPSSSYEDRYQTEQGNTLAQDLLRKALRWRWLIIGTTVACALLGLVITFMMTPQYTAVSTIEISRDVGSVTEFKGAEEDSSLADQEFYQTQYGLLEARSLAERIATNLRLSDDAAFFEMFGAPKTPAFEVNNGRYPAAGRAERVRQAGEILLENVSIAPTRMSRLVSISFTSPSPQLSARIANAWAENFITSNLERKSNSTSYGREQLQQQLAEYKARLDESQRQLVAYASNEEIINLPASGEGASERSLVVNNLEALNAELARATSDRISAEAQYRQAGKNGASAEALSNVAINSLRARRADLAAEYEQLMVRFEPGYPAAKALQAQITQLDSALAREEQRIGSSVQAVFQQAVARENELLRKVEGLKAEFLDLRRRSIQYNIFQQEVDTNKALYDGLLQRFKEIGIAGGVGINNVSIVDLANIPLVPSSPRLLINLAIAILAGLALGAGAALLLEQLDDNIKDAGEVSRRLGLPLLGVIPKTDEGAPKDVLLDRKSVLVDAYLSVFTNLGFTTANGVPRVLAVTSTRPSEGKSTTSLALAATISRSGKRVILVDGDMRSPSVHHLGGVSHDRGLSNFLAGDDAIETLTFPMEELGLTAMSAGPIPPNAAELLTGTRLSVLIERLLQTYDHVVIDCPPVLGLADALLIGSQVEGMVYAVEAHNMRGTQVNTSLARLRGANVKIYGAILTKFNARKGPQGYSYGSGNYDYGYTYGRDQVAADKG